MLNERKVVLYREVPAKAIFKVLKPETATLSGKSIPNMGVYVKIGVSHSVDITTNNKDCVFDGKMPCRILKTNFDTSHLPDWKVINQGKPHHAN